MEYGILIPRMVLYLMAKKFQLDLAFNLADYDTVWEAMGATLIDSIQPCNAIFSAAYIGRAPNSWPILRIVFASVECAKAFVYAYLGYTLANADEWDVHTDEAVMEYILRGEFCE
jgi:hypothetical protein